MPPRNDTPDVEQIDTELEQQPVHIAPGPIQLEIRVNGKIACLQRVHSYTIDQDTTQIAVYGQLTPQDRNVQS